MANDPFEAFRGLQRTLAAPLKELARNQRAIDQALQGPLREISRIQEYGARAAVVQGLETERAVQRALAGPLRSLMETQERVQRMLAGPLEVIGRNQQALAAGVTGPYAALLANQDLFVSAMRAAAGAGDFDVGSIDESPSTEAAWLVQWDEAISLWAPSRQQALDLLAALGFLIGLVAFGVTLMAPDGPTDEVLTAVSLLFGAGSMLIKYVGCD